MLHAILHGKAGRIEQEGESLRWRDLFKGSEDLLTATVFGRLPHLSDGALRAMLRFLLGDNPLDPAPFNGWSCGQNWHRCRIAVMSNPMCCSTLTTRWWLSK